MYRNVCVCVIVDFGCVLESSIQSCEASQGFVICHFTNEREKSQQQYTKRRERLILCVLFHRNSIIIE